MKKNLRPLVLLLMIGFLLLAAHCGVGAQTRTAPKGITITPAFQQISVDSGQDEVPITFSITNNESTAQTLAFSTADFNTLNESGGLFFVGTNPTALQKRYGLAKWLSLEQSQAVLEPKQTATFKASVLNPPDLSPGGHYGALMINLKSQNNSAVSGKVALNPLASSLLFVTKTGGDTHRLSLKNVTNNGNLFKLPSAISVRFHNDGNTHVTPRGLVTLTKNDGALISKGIINEGSNIILPEIYRQYYVPLNKISGGLAPGRYKLNVNFRFDGFDQVRSYQKTFTYIPVSLVLVMLVPVFVLIFAYKKLKQASKISKEK